jgi:hypothetical protein
VPTSGSNEGYTPPLSAIAILHSQRPVSRHRCRRERRCLCEGLLLPAVNGRRQSSYSVTHWSAQSHFVATAVLGGSSAPVLGRSVRAAWTLSLQARH